MSSALGAAEAPQTAVEGRPGFLRTAILGQPQAIFGLVVLAIFIVIGIVGPMIIGDAR